MNRDLTKDFFAKININLETIFADEAERNLGIIPLGVFKSAIEEAFIGQKIAFLYFGNCFMQTIENGFLFKDLANYMAASEAFYRPTGTDFKSIFQIMATENNGDTDRKIAQSICDRIPDKTNDPRMKEIYKKDLSKLKGIKNEFSFSVNSLERYSDLKEAVSELGEHLTTNSKLVNLDISSTREDIRICRDVWETQLLGITDLLRFCKNLEIRKEFEKRNVKAVESSIEKIKNFFNDKLDSEVKSSSIVVARYLPYKAFEPTKEGGTSVYPEGVSIFFPRKKPSSGEQDQYLKYYMDKFYKTDTFKHPFLEKNKWQKFVIDYYEPTGPDPFVRIINFVKRFFN
jgi:hypothetical protein